MDCLTRERRAEVRRYAKALTALKLMISSVRSHPPSKPGYPLLVASDVHVMRPVKHIVVILHRQLGAPFFQCNAACTR